MKAIYSLFLVLVVLVSAGAALDNLGKPSTNAAISFPGSPFGVAWGFAYGFDGFKAEQFLPQLHAMGGGFTKIYVFWNQVEPQKDHYDWTAIDAFLGQINDPNEALISVWSSSHWATRRDVNDIPASPAKNPDDYYKFIHELVQHAKGRVRYWQNDCEPNNPVFWDGTAQEFVSQLKVFHRAVKDADPKAVVIAGGYDGLFNPPGMWPFPGQERGLAFFDEVLRDGAGSFDVFDLRLYADPYTIPARVEFMRKKMTSLGYEKPVISTEYNGPSFFEYPQNLKYAAIAGDWASGIADDSPEKRETRADKVKKSIAALYEGMKDLPPQTQMFMQGCPPELESKLRRIQGRDLVMRNVLALSVGVQKTLFWDLWHGINDRDNLMTIMYGKLRLMDYEDGALKKEYPPAIVFRRMTQMMNGVQSVRRIDVPDKPGIFLFEIQRANRDPLYVVWHRDNSFSGEDSAPIEFSWKSSAKKVSATDVFGAVHSASLKAGELFVDVSVTPLYVEATK